MESANFPSPSTPAEAPLPIYDTQRSETSDGLSGCCAGGCPLHRFMWRMTAAFVVCGALGLGYLTWLTRHYAAASYRWELPATVDATASAISEKYSMATGFVGEDTEGLFVLDHNSGLLQCRVMYPRVGQFLGMFTVNVGDALGTAGKGGTYIMLTGQAGFARASNRPMAPTIVYVLNTATGDYAAYSVPFDITMVNNNRPQQAGLFLLGTGKANMIPERDPGR